MSTFMSYILSKYPIDKLQNCLYAISLIITINFNYSKQVNHLLEFIIRSALVFIKSFRR